MGIFDFLRKNKTEEVVEEVKENSIDNLKGLISLALKGEDQTKMTNFVEELFKADNDMVDELDILNSQEIVDFVYDEKVHFFGFFDWKQESSDFHSFVIKALKKNFSLELENENICDLDELDTIDLVYKQYGEELNKLGITW